MKFYIRTLGCKMNQLDSARVAAALRRAGHEPAPSEDQADCVLVNSCTVTAESDRKSRKSVNAALRAGKTVSVLGCGPRAAPQRWRAQVPQALVFESEQALLAHYGFEDCETPYPLSSRTRPPVAIQHGCDDECSFCITRIARGAHRSERLERVVDQVKEARQRGVAEVVLTGINLAAWGCENTREAGRSRLPELLHALLVRTDMPRIRLSSLGPQYLGRGFFEVLADPRICDHLHLSVQSGANAMLRAMRRGHDAAAVYRAAERARTVRPHVAVTADLIAGFPGERCEDHEQTLAMIRDLDFAKLHVFPFSAREGTPAAALPPRPGPEQRRRRAGELREAGREARRAFLARVMDSVQQVLVETDGTGLSGNYLRLRTPGAREGEILALRVTPHTLVQST